MFQSCEICGKADWQTQYQGRVRDGSFGNLSEDDCIVARCGECGVERLNESGCKNSDIYETEAYRRLLKEPDDVDGFMAAHDAIQLRNLIYLWPESLRSKVIADIGCAAGSFLDHVSGLARKIIAVEPCKVYHESLDERGYQVYAFTNEAAEDWAGRCDFSFCFSVIEHVDNPRTLLEEIRSLMAPKGKLIVSTPNRRDIMMDLKTPDYPRFFYRTVHRWYFDVDAFKYCANAAGLRVIDAQCVHRFGLSNAMAWMRDSRPTGSAFLPHMDDPILDNFWKGYLESKGVGDYLYFKLEKR
ncbi:MAG: class I SAM-dependent methyltransferase [Deltaproteobacteria bacterium]|nr:class I SAM-dependent methyltransferase [Deltaproteobacteria bacterium]